MNTGLDSCYIYSFIVISVTHTYSYTGNSLLPVNGEKRIMGLVDGCICMVDHYQVEIDSFCIIIPLGSGPERVW